MRILLIGERARAHNGGLNRVVTETCTGLARAGHEVGLAYHNDEPEVAGIDLFRLSRGGTVEEVAEAHARFRPDVVQVHYLADPGILPAIVGLGPTSVFLHDQTWFCSVGDRMTRDSTPCHRPHGVACLAWHYAQRCGGLRPWANWSLWKHTQRLAALKGLRSARIQVASRFMASGLAENGYETDRVDVVPLFAEPPPAEGEIEPGLVLLPSRLVPAKGVQVALDAMATIPSTPWRLAIAGDGWHRGELEAKARRLGIADRVQFLGEIPPAGLATWYARSQLVLFPVLRQEPFGLVGVESLAYGKPIVAFAGGAVDEWLWPGETGLRVEGRSADAFAAAIRELLTDPGRCAAMGAAARQRYPHFRPEAYVGRLVASFERTLGWAGKFAPVGPSK